MHVIVVKYVIVNKYLSAAHCLKQPIQTKHLNNLLQPTQELRQIHVESGNAYTEAPSSTALFLKR